MARAEELKPVLLVLEQLTLLLARDLDAQLGPALTPLALKGVGVREPLAPEVADWLEARLSSALHQGSQQQLVYCVSCRAQRTDLLDEAGERAWRLRQGVSSPSAIKALSQELKVGSMVDLLTSWDPELNTVHLRARLFNAQGAEVWAQDYRSGLKGMPQRVALPGAPKGTSSPQYQEQAQRYVREEDSPVVSVAFGWSLQPTWGLTDALAPLYVQSGALQAGYGERFGDEGRHRFALTGGLNAGVGLFAFQLGGEVSRRLSQPQSDPLHGWWVGAGASLNYVSFVQGVGLEFALEWVSSINLGARLDVGYQGAFSSPSEDNPSDPSGAYVSLCALFLL